MCPEQQGEDNAQNQNNDNHKSYNILCSGSSSCYLIIYLLPFAFQEWRRSKQRKEKKKERTSADAATDEKAFREEMAAEELAAMKSTKEEKEKAPPE